ncbi:MAG: hypothetical protein GY931_16445 [Maribacter sp.]|nr:hypothetical protein [Maribacter sp.]
MRLNLIIGSFLIANLWFHPVLSFGQQVRNVPEAFEALSSKPEFTLIKNKIKVPTEGGHLQGVQVIDINGTEKILISGSSLTTAYILQADLPTKKTDTLINLMHEPYRHAGGIQISEPYLAVGIEDNYSKITSKVCLYNYRNGNLYKAHPNVIINRKGEAKLQTAGATGLLRMVDDYLMVVGNWDSRNWDFYCIDPEKSEQKMLVSFAVPEGWAGYQSINLIKDEKDIYAIGFYKKDGVGYTDLILVSKLGTFVPLMKKVLTKTFNGIKGVDFGTATGLQVDKEGNLHIWAVQSNALKRITVNKFSQQ